MHRATAHAPAAHVADSEEGDIEGAKYKGYGQSITTVMQERGVRALWAGAPWRIFRQFCCFLLFDKINTDLAPILFPHAFKK